MKETLNAQMNIALSQVVSGLQSIPETRPQQLAMAQMIRRFLHFSQGTTGKTLLIEAGTGVGKSFAYLTPICEHLRVNPDSKVVIGTNTISLQEQLFMKDIPFVLRYYPNIVAEKAKGRGNYICLRKLNEIETDLFAANDAQRFGAMINDWLETDPDQTGEKSQIPFQYDDKLWQLVDSEAGRCIDNLCEYRKDCFFQKSRSKLESSNIIIANHAMILSDYIQQVLPEYDTLVLDEGHNFEANSLSIMTKTIKSYEITNIVAALNRNLIKAALRSARKLTAIEGIQSDLKNTAQSFFGSLEAKRYMQPEINQHGERLLAVLEQAIPVLAQAIEKSPTPFIKTEVSKLKDRIFDIHETLFEWINQPLPGYVYWTEENSINHCPLDIAAELQGFWQAKNTIITSATLTVNRSFKPFRNSLGLSQNCYTLRFGSPFNYRENSVVYQPPNAPAPNSDDYTTYLCKTIETILNKKSGKTFVLFTSYRMMQSVFTEISPKFPQFNWLLQGTGSKEILLSNFRENPNSILFGTDTFWEGVDEEINCVIITKLPFEVPTTPIKEAQYELVKSRGGNSFMELSIPRCAIKLKQGTGRLIRNTYQKGVIVICDPRIRKPWGKIIKNTLPEMPWTEELESIDTYLSVG